MAIPASAPTIDQAIDPSDRVEFVAQFGLSVDGRSPLLETGETIETLEITPLPDAAALGFTIMEGVVDALDRGPWIADNTNAEFWAEVEEANRGDAAYTAGAILGAQVTITTSHGRRYQRTVGVRAIQS